MRDRAEQEAEQHEDRRRSRCRAARQRADPLDLGREIEVVVGQPAGVVRGERDPHLAPAHVEVGMVIGLLGEEADPHDERDRGRERRRSRRS